MTHGYLMGPDQPDTEIIMPKGQTAIAGHAIGILVVDLWYPLLPGNVANASTYNFPVIYKVLKGASVDEILSGDPSVLKLIIEGGNELIRLGARAVVGPCGSFANFQKEAAKALGAPTFLSVMLQVPLILQSLMPEQKIGIVAASSDEQLEKVFDQCDIRNPSRLVVIGAQDLSEIQKIDRYERGFNSYKLEQELKELVKQSIKDHPEIGALLLKCSDFPLYAWAIQNATRLPVFDMISLINWVYYGVVRMPFRGFI